jgi:hypothetical protein
MRAISLSALLLLALSAPAADVESRVLTHYVPQDTLETIVRTEGWTEITLKVKGEVRKGDTIRIWTGGLIDRGNGDQPGENVNPPTGLAAAQVNPAHLAISSDINHAYAILVKTESTGPVKPMQPGKPLEIKLTKDKEKLWIGFNDEKGRFNDNHLGKGRRHELDPMWMRIEVVRTVVD